MANPLDRLQETEFAGSRTSPMFGAPQTLTARIAPAASLAWLSADLAGLHERLRRALASDAAHLPGAREQRDRFLADLEELDRALTDSSVRPEHPIDVLCRRFELSAFERDLLVLATCVELHPVYYELVHLLEHNTAGRPTLSLALQLFGVQAQHYPRALSSVLPQSPLVGRALLCLEGSGPLLTRGLCPVSDVWPRLVGLPVKPPYEIVAPDPRLLRHMTMPNTERKSLERVLERLAHFAAGEGTATVIIQGPRGSGREAVARALAGQLDMPTLHVTSSQLQEAAIGVRVCREADWHEAAIVVRVEDPEQAAAAYRSIAEVRQPIIWVGENQSPAELLTNGSRTLLSLTVSEPGLDQRTALWETMLPKSRRNGVDLRQAASRYLFGPGRIQHAVRFAEQRAALRGGQDALVEERELNEACRELPAHRLNQLAARLPCTYGFEDLVVPPEVLDELKLALAWVRQRSRVFSDWGYDQKLTLGTGLTCLFSGPPGTGKTMAAQILGGLLGLELYRIELSRVVSKYIGETEKNLATLFDEARAANAILFFDEADALFGKRTEVRDAHDRNANVETGFLLQRLELHPGVVVLATNLKQNLDEAFLRRLHVLAEFPMPDASHRRRIWKRLLPPPHALAEDVDIELLAERFDLSGGSIRNAALAAAFMASEQNSAVGMKYLVRAVWRELRKGGRIVDPSTFGVWRDAVASNAAGSIA